MLIGPDRYLVPVDPGEQFDPFELNLFACKPDRAKIPLWPGTPPVAGRAVLRYPGQGTGGTNEIRGQLPELLQIRHSDHHASNCTRAEFTIPRTISSKLHRGSQPN